jgi:drug/metabolite transporter (DMT)-like permease
MLTPWIMTFFVALTSVYSYIYFRNAFESEYLISQYMYANLAIFLAGLGFVVYLGLIKYSDSCYVALYYIFTFLGIFLVGWLLFGECITKTKILSSILIVVGLVIWGFF